MVLVDTSVWIDYFRGVTSIQADKLDQLLDEERVVTGDLIIVELMQGFKTKAHINIAHKIISCLEYYDLVGKEVALKSAENFRFLRTHGITIRKTIDVIIGTFCIVNGIKLLHCDHDFEPMQHYFNLQCV